jgi:hypothetical protein
VKPDSPTSEIAGLTDGIGERTDIEAEVLPLSKRERETALPNATKANSSTTLHRLLAINGSINLLFAAKEILISLWLELSGCLSTLKRLIFIADLDDSCDDFASGHSEWLVNIIDVLQNKL